MTKNGSDSVVPHSARRTEELMSMIEIGKALTSSLEVHEVLESIMKQVDRLIKPKAWSLLLVDAASGDLTFEIAVSPVAENLKGIRLKKDEGIAGWVARHGKPLLLPDVRQDERFAAYIDEKLSFTTRSIVCVPMKIKEKIIGVIELLNSYDELMFDHADMAILSAIADFAAIALENARNYDRINELVITDDLTGLYNSRHFGQHLECEVERAIRYNTELSLIFLDVDHLKEINDTHGHLVGSRMLSEFGKIIGKCIRSSDMAARYGGDEYAIVLPQTGKSKAVAMVGKVMEKMRSNDFRSDSGVPIHLTASFGVATFPEDAGNRLELVRAADTAMYDAKRSGRDGVKVFVQEMVAP